MKIQLTEYVIRLDHRLKGWIAFKVVKSGGPKFETLDRTPVTSPKPKPHLAARALIRTLLQETKKK